MARLARVRTALRSGGAKLAELGRVRCSGGKVKVFTAADVGLLERAAHCDDPVRARQLELEVGVVGHCHELGVGGALENGVVYPPSSPPPGT